MRPDAIKLLVDLGVGLSVEKWLAGQGYNVKSVRDIDPRLSDREILNIAVAEGRMVVTMDKDFGELVYNSGLEHRGVLLLRLEDAGAGDKIATVKDIFEKHADKLMGNFSVFKDGRLRIRKQPTND